MARTRISTTVDARRLDDVRRRLGVPDSEIVDRALAVLVEQLDALHEQVALEEQPYEADPDLAWDAPPGPDLPYDGQVPAEVLELAAARRRAARGSR